MGCKTEEFSMIDMPIGTLLLWEQKNKIPYGYIAQGNARQFMLGQGLKTNLDESTIIILKVDNLTWIEHLAKERHLV